MRHFGVWSCTLGDKEVSYGPVDNIKVLIKFEQLDCGYSIITTTTID